MVHEGIDNHLMDDRRGPVHSTCVLRAGCPEFAVRPGHVMSVSGLDVSVQACMLQGIPTLVRTRGSYVCKSVVYYLFK